MKENPESQGKNEIKEVSFKVPETPDKDSTDESGATSEDIIEEQAFEGPKGKTEEIVVAESRKKTGKAAEEEGEKIEEKSLEESKGKIEEMVTKGPKEKIEEIAAEEAREEARETKEGSKEEKSTIYTMGRRLTKSKTERKIFGVCGGLGEYFGIDPTLVRLAFVVLALFNGIGLVIYIILAIIMPPGESVAMVPSTQRGNLRK
jgi:phage shock protein C